MKKIYFVISNFTIGSAIMSGLHIRDGLSSLGVECEVITHNQIDTGTKGAIFIWVKDINPNTIKSLKNNIHLYSPVDSLATEAYHMQIIKQKLFDGIFVNSSYMKEQLIDSFDNEENIHVIPQNWDPRFADKKVEEINDIKFGYIGSIASLRTSDNLVNHFRLAKDHKVSFVDCETGLDLTEIIKNGQYPPSSDFKPDWIVKAPMNFNCHMSIRSPSGNGFKYKPATKVVVAAALNQNILTTNDEAVKDVLPEDYPFTITSSSYDEVGDMINKIKEDYYGDKNLWNLGLSIMGELKIKLSLKEISKLYKKSIEMY